MSELGSRDASASGQAIVAEHLCKIFEATKGMVRRRKSQVVALKDVSFAVDYGELFGLVGRARSRHSVNSRWIRSIRSIRTHSKKNRKNGSILAVDLHRDAEEHRLR